MGAILTQNTAWANVEKAIANLRQANALSLKTVVHLSLPRLAQLVRPSGYFRQKAKRLKALARTLHTDQDFFRQLSGQSKAELIPLRARLLEVHGVGPETADSILLYAGRYPIFVVDAYTRRIGQRMGLFKTNAYRAVQAYFSQVLPPKTSMYNEFHALLVMLAKHFCTSHDPFCETCPVRADCAYGRKKRA